MNANEIDKIADTISEKMFDACKDIFADEFQLIFDSVKIVNGNDYQVIHMVIIDKLVLNLCDILFSIAQAHECDKNSMQNIIDVCMDRWVLSKHNANSFF